MSSTQSFTEARPLTEGPSSDWKMQLNSPHPSQLCSWIICLWYSRMLAGCKKFIFVSGFPEEYSPFPENTAAWAGCALPLSLSFITALLKHFRWWSSSRNVLQKCLSWVASAEMDILVNCPKSGNYSCWQFGKCFQIMNKSAGIRDCSWKINDSFTTTPPN